MKQAAKPAIDAVAQSPGLHTMIGVCVEHVVRPSFLLVSKFSSTVYVLPPPPREFSNEIRAKRGRLGRRGTGRDIVACFAPSRALPRPPLSPFAKDQGMIAPGNGELPVSCSLQYRLELRFSRLMHLKFDLEYFQSLDATDPTTQVFSFMCRRRNDGSGSAGCF